MQMHVTIHQLSVSAVVAMLLVERLNLACDCVKWSESVVHRLENINPMCKVRSGCTPHLRKDLRLLCIDIFYSNKGNGKNPKYLGFGILSSIKSMILEHVDALPAFPICVNSFRQSECSVFQSSAGMCFSILFTNTSWYCVTTAQLALFYFKRKTKA